MCNLIVRQLLNYRPTTVGRINIGKGENSGLHFRPYFFGSFKLIGTGARLSYISRPTANRKSRKNTDFIGPGTASMLLQASFRYTTAFNVKCLEEKWFFRTFIP